MNKKNIKKFSAILLLSKTYYLLIFLQKKAKIEFTENGLLQKLLQFLISMNIPLRCGYSKSLIDLLQFCREDG